MRAFVINREVDLHRWTFISNNARDADGLEIVRVDAIDGFLEEFDAATFSTKNCSPKLKTPESLQARANAACFLSHVVAWQKIYDGSAPYGLVLEDDVFLADSFDELSSELDKLTSFDLVYINEAMVERRSLFQPKLANDHFVSVDENYLLMRTKFTTESGLIRDGKGGKLKAPGGYGYILSKSGALKLMQHFEVDSRPIELDSYVYFKSLTENTLDKSKNTRYIAQIERSLRAKAGIMKSYIYKASMVRHKASAVGGSVRAVKDLRK